MSAVSKWEIAGVPAAVLFEALHVLGAFTALGIDERELPHLMVAAFVAVAVLRAGFQTRRAAKPALPVVIAQTTSERDED